MAAAAANSYNKKKKKKITHIRTHRLYSMFNNIIQLIYCRSFVRSFCSFDEKQIQKVFICSFDLKCELMNNVWKI